MSVPNLMAIQTMVVKEFHKKKNPKSQPSCCQRRSERITRVSRIHRLGTVNLSAVYPTDRPVLPSNETVREADITPWLNCSQLIGAWNLC